MATSLGIHLRADGFSYALLEGSTKKPVLKASGEGSFPSALAAPRELGKLIADAVKLRKADHLTVGVPSQRVVLRELSLPFQDRDKVLQVLKFEIESELYHMSVDDVIADFLPLEGERATPSLLVGVMPKKHVKQAIAISEGAGWDPAVIGVSYSGFASAIATLAPKLAGPEEIAKGVDAAPLAFVHLGAGETLLALTGPTGQLRALRTLPIGWLEMVRDLAPVAAPDAVADATVTPAPEAAAPEKGKGAEAEDAEEPPSILFDADPALPVGMGLTEALELAGHTRSSALCKRLANEIRRGLAAMQAGATQIHLLGADLPGLDEALTARAGIPAQRLHHEQPNFDRADLVALGLALEGLAGTGEAMNFRQEEFRYARGLERVEGPLTLALVGLIAWFVIDSGVNLKQGMHLKSEADRVYVAANARVEDLNKRVRDDEDYPDIWLIKNDLSGLDISEGERILQLDGRVKAARKQLDELMGQSDLEMPPSCLEAWRLLMGFLEKELGTYPDKWMVESFDFTSVDRGRGGSGTAPHVEARFNLTLKSEDAERVAATFDRLDRGLREQPWIIGVPSIPTTESAKVGPGKTASITVSISTARVEEVAKP